MTEEHRRADACPFSGAPRAPLPGFRHFLGEPAAAERFRVDGADPRESPEALATLRRRLRGLALLMGERPTGAPENPQVPSGYTYLLQFMGHDLVSTSIAFWAANARTPGVANTLGAPLRLRTLYGDGPGACPVAFAPDDARDQYRSRFRLSSIGGEAERPDRYRDIARAATPGTLGTRRGQGEALIPDGRNDQNAVLSQLTALFQMLHNAILGMIPAPGTAPAAALRQATEARFAAAREATTLVFRAILRHDVLPRVLHPAVQALYAGPAPELLDRTGEAAVPLEFSHGAIRFGHAMPRDHYRIGSFEEAPLADMLRLTSSRSPNSVPLTRRWIARWSQFFQLPDQPAPNASMRLGPHYSLAFTADGLFDPIAGGDPAGVAFRDLMSAGLAGLRSVANLAETITRQRPELARLSPMLAEPAQRRAALAAWLGRDRWLSLLEEADVAGLTADPPLPFYILFEAAEEAEGRHLGILGSLLVAETVYGALARDPLPSEAGGGGLAAALDRLAAHWLGDWRFPEPPVVQDMPGLVTFIASRLGLEAADPAFL